MRVSAICPPMIEPETKPAAPEPEHEVGTSPPCGSLEAPRKTGEQLCYKDLVIGDEAMGGAAELAAPCRRRGRRVRPRTAASSSSDHGGGDFLEVFLATDTASP